MKPKTSELSHLDAEGRAHMVDVGDKPASRRSASAECQVVMAATTLEAITEGRLPKGDVFAVARIAGIQAAKKTSDLIPLCHPLPLTSVELELLPDAALPGVVIRAHCRVTGQTGVEMEALTAVSVAALTLYDMCKAIDRGIEIQRTVLLNKSGGQSGNWDRGTAC